jgi:hypothetical protein
MDYSNIKNQQINFKNISQDSSHPTIRFDKKNIGKFRKNGQPDPLVNKLLWALETANVRPELLNFLFICAAPLETFSTYADGRKRVYTEQYKSPILASVNQLKSNEEQFVNFLTATPLNATAMKAEHTQSAILRWTSWSDCGWRCLLESLRVSCWHKQVATGGNAERLTPSEFAYA